VESAAEELPFVVLEIVQDKQYPAIRRYLMVKDNTSRYVLPDGAERHEYDLVLQSEHRPGMHIPVYDSESVIEIDNPEDMHPASIPPIYEAINRMYEVCNAPIFAGGILGEGRYPHIFQKNSDCPQCHTYILFDPFHHDDVFLRIYPSLIFQIYALRGATVHEISNVCKPAAVKPTNPAYSRRPLVYAALRAAVKAHMAQHPRIQEYMLQYVSEESKHSYEKAGFKHMKGIRNMIIKRGDLPAATGAPMPRMTEPVSDAWLLTQPEGRVTPQRSDWELLGKSGFFRNPYNAIRAAQAKGGEAGGTVTLEVQFHFPVPASTFYALDYGDVADQEWAFPFFTTARAEPASAAAAAGGELGAGPVSWVVPIEGQSEFKLPHTHP
jgi:hypothetical protein